MTPLLVFMVEQQHHVGPSGPRRFKPSYGVYLYRSDRSVLRNVSAYQRDGLINLNMEMWSQ